MVASWIGLALVALLKALRHVCLSSRLASPFHFTLDNLPRMGFVVPRRAQRFAVLALVALAVTSVHGDANQASEVWLRPLIGQLPFATAGTYMNLSPGRAVVAWSRDGEGQLLIDIPPDRGEVLYAVAFDRTLGSQAVLVQVGADRPMPIEVFIETELADWRSRHSVVLNLDGTGVQTFVVPLSHFKQGYHTSGQLIGVHFSEAVRASLPGLKPGAKAYAAGIIVNGFPDATIAAEVVTEGKVTLRQLGTSDAGKSAALGPASGNWIHHTRSGNPFDLSGTFRWEDRTNAGVPAISSWSRNQAGEIVGVIPQGRGEVQYGRAIEDELSAHALYIEVGSSVAQSLNIYLDQKPDDITARRFAEVRVTGNGVQRFLIPLAEFGLARGARVYQVGVQDMHDSEHTLTIAQMSGSPPSSSDN
jgi:hypothetical protein